MRYLLENTIPALISFFAWPAPLYLVFGTMIGMLFGIMPGLGGPQVLALLLPLTLTMSPDHAIITLIAASGAVPLGGSIPAILINTPGTGQSAATVFDGFPLAQKGKAGMALGAALTASLFGAIFGAIILTFILPFGRYIVLAFSYPEYFMLAIMGLSVIAVVSMGSFWKAMIAAGIGLLLATIGYDPITGELRFTFDNTYLYDGIKLIPALIGLFAIAESFALFTKKDAVADKPPTVGFAGIWEGAKAVFKHKGVFFRGSIIGTLIGIIPGVGGAVANFIAYGQTVQTAKEKENFGKGDIRGVIAPESANNAKDGGSLVPTLIFGIPGSADMAVLLGALVLHGIQPGPRLMLDKPTIVLQLIYALIAANIVVTILGVALAGQLTRLTKVRGTLLAPVILVLGLLGAYMTNGIYGDVIVALVFGLLGYVMHRFGFSKIPLVIALVLGELMQQNFEQTLMTTGIAGFFTRPLSLTLLIITIVMVVYPFWKNRKKAGAVS